MTDVYEASASNLSTASRVERKGFLRRSWHGQIKLWQAFWISHVLGFVVALVLALTLGYTVAATSQAHLQPFVEGLVLCVYVIFTAVSLWRNSPPLRRSILGALVKLWSIVFTAYLVVFSVSFLISR